MVPPDLSELQNYVTATEFFHFLEDLYNSSFELLIELINEVFTVRWKYESRSKFNFNQIYTIKINATSLPTDLGRLSVACYHLIQRMSKYDIFFPLNTEAAFYHVIVFGISNGSAKAQYWEDFVNNHLDFLLNNFKMYLQTVSYSNHYEGLANRLRVLSYLLQGLNHMNIVDVEKCRALVKIHAT